MELKPLGLTLKAFISQTNAAISDKMETIIKILSAVTEDYRKT